MFSLSLFLICAGILYLNSQNHFDAQDLLEYATYIVGFSVVIAATFMYLGDDIPSAPSFYNLAFAPFFALMVYYIKKKTKPKSLEIQASQQRYFSEISAQDIYNFYAARKELKSNRVETLVNKESKKLLKNGVIVPQFFLDLKNFAPTKIKKVAELAESQLKTAIFEKIKGFAKQLEMPLDYDAILLENGNCAEFFLLDLWERLTSPFNIGIANLEILACDSSEIELLGALDLVNLNCVKRKGAVLYYKFMEFKGRVKDFSKESQINPQEAEFDENYIKENNND